MAEHAHLVPYVQYIRNTARVPLRVDWFDDDWDPVGPMLREQLVAAGWIRETPGGLLLTETAPPDGRGGGRPRG